ncbi:hypothetical protein ACPCAB_20400 [Streptomyces koyangensis]|uniref:hypothetical protein n=1 Tax=Streptomyces koyangensis TaxID=188770 RepID=UPI003C2DBE11
MTAILTHEATREAVRDAGRTLGLPEPVTEAFVRLLRPCVYLCPYAMLPEELRGAARPAARSAGPAQLPEGHEIPAYIPHLLTIDCAAVPTGVLDIDFPTDGEVVILAEITDQDEGYALHVPRETETVEHPSREQPGPDAPNQFASFPLYPVPGTTLPGRLRWSRVPEAAGYAGEDAERGVLLDTLTERMESILAVRWAHEIQLGGYAPAWHDPLEDQGDILFLSIPEDAVFGGDCITLVLGTPEQIAERRYEELEFRVES